MAFRPVSDRPDRLGRDRSIVISIVSTRSAPLSIEPNPHRP